jgi:isocitrate dehydrogenase (NAD+)
MSTTSGRVPVTLIPGDGVGPEIMDSTKEVLLQMGAKIDFEEVYFSEVNRGASSSLEEVTALVKKNKVALRGVMGIPEYGQGGELMGLNSAFRKELDLYANVVRVRSLPGVKSRHQNIDTVIIRQRGSTQQLNTSR